MKVNSKQVETFIFMTHGNMVKVVMDFDRKMCTVYSDKNRILLKLEKVTPMRMNELKRKISKYIEAKKKNSYNMYNGMGAI